MQNSLLKEALGFLAKQALEKDTTHWKTIKVRKKWDEKGFLIREFESVGVFLYKNFKKSYIISISHFGDGGYYPADVAYISEWLPYHVQAIKNRSEWALEIEPLIKFVAQKVKKEYDILDLDYDILKSINFILKDE